MPQKGKGRSAVLSIKSPDRFLLHTQDLNAPQTGPERRTCQIRRKPTRSARGLNSIRVPPDERGGLLQCGYRDAGNAPRGPIRAARPAPILGCGDPGPSRRGAVERPAVNQRLHQGVGRWPGRRAHGLQLTTASAPVPHDRQKPVTCAASAIAPRHNLQ
jgi:hypothetical protein